jgi:hypothetical protein
MENNTLTTQPKEQFSLMPKNFDEFMSFAQIVAQSTMVPKDYINNPGNVIIAVEMGYELGLKPLQSLQNISVINGRPSLWGNILPAIAYNSGQCEYIKEELSSDKQVATCRVKRKGQPEVVQTFSIQDAQKANLLGKDNWRYYPQRMIARRAKNWAINDAFPDLLLGMSIQDEMEDFVHTQTENIKEVPKTLEQLGLSCKQDDGKLVVIGNTFGKTDMLRDLGFTYKDKIWYKDLPIEAADVIEAKTITKETAEVVQTQEQIVEKTTTESTQESKESIDEVAQPEKVEVQEVKAVNLAPKTKQEHELLFNQLGLNFLTEIDNRNTSWFVITDDIDDLNEAQKNVLRIIGFKNSRKRGLIKNISDLIETSKNEDVEEQNSQEDLKPETTPFDEDTKTVEDVVQVETIQENHSVDVKSSSETTVGHVETLPFDEEPQQNSSIDDEIPFN